MITLATASSCMFFRSLDELTTATDAAADRNGSDATDDANESDAKPSDASAGDAADSNVTQDAAPLLGGPSLCASAGLDFCNGFEESALANGPWSVRRGTVEVDTTRAARGARSMHAHVEMTTPSPAAYVALAATFVRPWQSLFLRAFVFVPSGQGAQDTGMVWAYNNAAGYKGGDLGIETGGHLRFRAPNNDFVGKTASAALPVDRWACLELELFPINGTTAGARGWLDGTKLDVELENVDTSAIDTVQFGIQTAAQSPAFDIWYDEVAFDGQRIGCQQ